MERILLAVDGSEASARAAEFAGELADRFEVPVSVIHVIPEGELPASGSHTYMPENLDIESFYENRTALLEARARSLLDEATQLVQAAGGEVDMEQIAVGNVAQVIADTAESRDADCIVMGRRGVGEIEGLFGSVTHKVAHLTKRTLITTE